MLAGEVSAESLWDSNRRRKITITWETCIGIRIYRSIKEDHPQQPGTCGNLVYDHGQFSYNKGRAIIFVPLLVKRLLSALKLFIKIHCREVKGKVDDPRTLGAQGSQGLRE